MHEKYVDRKIGMMLSFMCCMKRNQKGAFALDANKLILKILETGLSVDMAMELYSILCRNTDITINDAARLKELLKLTSIEAIDIFLS